MRGHKSALSGSGSMQSWSSWRIVHFACSVDQKCAAEGGCVGRVCFGEARWESGVLQSIKGRKKVLRASFALFKRVSELEIDIASHVHLNCQENASRATLSA